MNETIQTIAKQVNSNELAMRKFKFVFDDKKNSLTLIKGKKYLTITYNEGSDMYDIEKLVIQGLAIVKSRDKIEGLFCDQLADIIEDFFKIDYLNKPRFD